MKRCLRCGSFFEGDDLWRCPADGSELTVVAADDPDAPDPLLGQVIDGRFRVLDVLGQGGMGAVYRAEQTSVGRQVALKVIRGERTAQLAKRFMLEARMTSSLSDVHTVTIIDFGESREHDLLYLAMELLDGRPLDVALSSEGAFDWARAARVVAQVAESLVEAHAAGIVHRDLKPANIYLARMGEDCDFVKVLDFGVGKFLSADTTTNLTGTGIVIGTPAYMAPEQARAESIDARADIYALGCVFYEMLAGEPPFRGESAISVLMKHCQDPVPALEGRQPPGDIPEGVRDMVQWMLRKQPGARPRSAAVVRDAVRCLLTDPAARPAVPRPSVSSPSTEVAGKPDATPVPAPTETGLGLAETMQARTTKPVDALRRGPRRAAPWVAAVMGGGLLVAVLAAVGSVWVGEPSAVREPANEVDKEAPEAGAEDPLAPVAVEGLDAPQSPPIEATAVAAPGANESDVPAGSDPGETDTPEAAREPDTKSGTAPPLGPLQDSKTASAPEEKPAEGRQSIGGGRKRGKGKEDRPRETPRKPQREDPRPKEKKEEPPEEKPEPHKAGSMEKW